MKQAKPIIHGLDHLPGGPDPTPFAFLAEMTPAVTAWSLVMTRGVVVAPTVGGAGYGGSDWAAPPIYFVVGLGHHGVQDTNSWNDDDPDAISPPVDTATAGDLYQAGIKIYSLHYPLTDWSFVSGDDVASLRVSQAYQGTYRVRCRFAVTSDNANSQLVAVAVEGYAVESTGRFQQTVGSNYLISVNQPTLPDPTGAYDQELLAVALTDPGSQEWAFTSAVSAAMDGLFATDIDYSADSDLVIRVWNPGPDDVTLDIALFVEKLDTSHNIFAE